MNTYYQIGASALLILIFLAGCGSDNDGCNLNDVIKNSGSSSGTTSGNTTVCTPGDVTACYPGTPGTLNVGTCTAGSQTCNSQGEFGNCVGAIIPSTEICDGLDNDCDGTDDNNCI